MSITYSASGVNIDMGNRAVELMRDAVRATYNQNVLAGIGAFGGLFDAHALQTMRAPVLVASTDGVGTKVKLAAQANRFDGIGRDLVNHCINDILVQGARPLFFLDYIASSRTIPENAAAIVTSMAQACRDAKIALLGGETAEMPGVYLEKEFDVAGTIVGVVERDNILPRNNLCTGDVLIGLRSSGPHTNGYSLIRKIFADVPLDTVFPELGDDVGAVPCACPPCACPPCACPPCACPPCACPPCACPPCACPPCACPPCACPPQGDHKGAPLQDALLAPHRSYLPLLEKFLAQPSPLKALAHITGGGMIENLPRVLPNHLAANIYLDAWRIPPLFQLIQQRGNIATPEMFRVFNMGIGMIAIVSQNDAQDFQNALGEESFVIGELRDGARGVHLGE
ncbi:MAG: phosphoribosylformylglycinamidine cyclo-ligase [Chloroflexi bacterium]|nr:phosphoribosylformylglycinamidine cyclo-ligase [Chloroflexota bacterium]